MGQAVFGIYLKQLSQLITSAANDDDQSEVHEKEVILIWPIAIRCSKWIITQIPFQIP